ncbi:hypothetical protein D0Z07_2175 [Hyphodiscus hymeniophilus]|uniref:NmrA-like domain-containing protein n=1 Tax=Hyphodiscus hymeniophilus TaxID=353542 RepID=A0A9P7AZT0_9HELO|nr:hypothetical protein D0Z07_2175 [Hyphodiscus hymeniophilus]
MPLQKVILVGANGKLGPALLDAFFVAKTYAITVLSRHSSTSKYPDSVRVVYVSDDPDTEELARALQGQDAVVVAFAGTLSGLQIRLADAAVQAGVKRFIPADYGSCDSSSPRALKLMPLYGEKKKVREHLQQLASSSGLSWTSLICGHFFDYGLKSGLLQVDLKLRKAKIFDGGEIRWSTTTVGTIALAVVRILQKEEETKNRLLYIQSVCITQNELVQSLERNSGQEWQVEHINSDEFIKEVKAVVDKDPSYREGRENLVSVVGILDANWEGKADFANSLLGLDEEHLDPLVKNILAETKSM